MKDNLIMIICGVSLIAAAVLGTLFFTGCKTAPVRNEYKNDIGFMLADCLHRSSNPTVCGPLALRYVGSDKEQAYKNILIFCSKKENRPEFWDFEKCRLYLNQK